MNYSVGQVGLRGNPRSTRSPAFFSRRKSSFLSFSRFFLSLFKYFFFAGIAKKKHLLNINIFVPLLPEERKHGLCFQSSSGKRKILLPISSSGEVAPMFRYLVPKTSLIREIRLMITVFFPLVVKGFLNGRPERSSQYLLN